MVEVIVTVVFKAWYEGLDERRQELGVSGGRPIRVFYAFDPMGQAVLLLGADKTGRKRFYEEMIVKAEILWERYLQGK